MSKLKNRQFAFANLDGKRTPCYVTGIAAEFPGVGFMYILKVYDRAVGTNNQLFDDDYPYECFVCPEGCIEVVEGKFIED